jgi:HSP20 family protein
MRSLVRKNDSFRSSFPSLMDDFFGSNLFDTDNGDRGTLPSVNVREGSDDFHIEVAAPGMKRDDFHVELDGNVLTISSEKEENREDRDKDGNYTRREFSYQSFRRSFTLPQNRIKGEGIRAKYTDGILHVTVPKSEEGKTRAPRQITVS